MPSKTTAEPSAWERSYYGVYSDENVANKEILHWLDDLPQLFAL